MPAPLERDRQYVDKFLAEQFFLVVDFSERLPAGISVSLGGAHTVNFFRVTDGVDVTASICDVSTLGPDNVGLSLRVNLIPQVASLVGTYRGVFKAQTTQGAPLDFEVMEAWVRVRSQ